MIFMIAYWLYVDGVGTIIRMAVNYGLSLGFNPDSLILALLITQFVCFPAAIASGALQLWWVDEKDTAMWAASNG